MSWSASIRAEIEAEFAALTRQPTERELVQAGMHITPCRAQGVADNDPPVRLATVPIAPPLPRRVIAVDLHDGLATYVLAGRADDNLIYVVDHRASHDIAFVAASVREVAHTGATIIETTHAAATITGPLLSFPAGKRAPKRVAAALPSVRLVGARQLTGDELPALLAALTVITRN